MPVVVWITGLPGSGKSTVADALRMKQGDFIVLSMDELRSCVTPEPTYSEDEREKVYRCLVYAAKKLCEAGHDVVIDATGNRREWRMLMRKLVPRFYEVYLKCSLSCCRKREKERHERHGAPAEIYKKAEEGAPVPGVTVPYEAPEKPDLTIDTEKVSPDDAALLIVKMIQVLS